MPEGSLSMIRATGSAFHPAATLLLSLLVTGSAMAQPSSGPSRRINQQLRSAATTSNEPLPDLKSIGPKDGRSHVELSVKFGENPLNGTLIKHRSYDGALVGPIIRIRPGDLLEVDLANKLPAEPAQPDH